MMLPNAKTKIIILIICQESFRGLGQTKTKPEPKARINCYHSINLNRN